MTDPPDRTSVTCPRRRGEPAPLALPHLLLALLVVAVCAAFFAVLAAQVLAGAPITAADHRIALWLYAHARPPLTALMLFFTFLGAPLCVTIITVGVVILLVRRSRWYSMLLLVLAMSGGGVLIPLLKLSFLRARPVFDSPLAYAHGYSFPSGHAILAMLLYGTLAYIALGTPRRRASRLGLLAAATAMIAAIDFSRMYLGVHYLSDVLAGTAAAIAWLVLSILVVDTQRRRARPRR